MIHRRGFLIGAGSLVAVPILSSCGLLSREPEGEQRRSGAKGEEAPELAERVKAGELPPLAERIPKEPMVVEPIDEIGVYGGDWRTVLLGSEDVPWLDRTMNYEYLTRWNPEFTQAIPNVAQDYEFSSDGTRLTFKLREGMKWSDGEPFTADDVVFAYYDVMLNEQFFGAEANVAVTSGGKRTELEKIDDHTVVFIADPPNGLLLQNLATPLFTSVLTWRPKHYLQQFHEKYNPEVVKLADEAGLPSWVDLFLDRSNAANNPEMPRMSAWLPTSAHGAGPRMVFERNPYYWKVDPEGSQLPYLDRVVFDVVGDEEVIVLRASGGDIDMDSRHLGRSPRNKPVLASKRTDGNFDFFDLTPGASNWMVLNLNLTVVDPVKREMFRNKDFRIGLSHAINRQEIIDGVVQRQGEPYQVAPRPDSPFYDEEMAKQYTEYDLDLANSSLDRAGYTDRDGGGMRLGPDGKPITFTVDVDAARTEWVSGLELIRGHLAEVGIDMQIKGEDRSLFTERIDSNQHEAAAWNDGGGAGLLPVLSPDYWFPSGGGSYRFAPLWTEWYLTNGEGGEEPPPEVRAQMETYQREVLTAVDDDVRNQAMQKVLQMSKEFFYHIGISLAPTGFGIVRNDFHNVPKIMTDASMYPTPGPSNPEQYFTTRT